LSDYSFTSFPHPLSVADHCTHTAHFAGAFFLGTDKVFAAVIPRNVEIKDAHFNRKDIFVFNPHAKSAHAYNKLIDEMFPELRPETMEPA
jgi:hypothetical protein